MRSERPRPVVLPHRELRPYQEGFLARALCQASRRGSLPPGARARGPEAAVLPPLQLLRDRRAHPGRLPPGAVCVGGR
eukprot:11173109-Lingulodinium_polyedra.AAC.1